MRTDRTPIVYKIADNLKSLLEFQDTLEKNAPKKEQDVMLQFPTVYIHSWQDVDDYEVYIGESNNVIQRTKQHYDLRSNTHKWQHQLSTHDAILYIIGHEHFNKSLTLDIEHRLMH